MPRTIDTTSVDSLVAYVTGRTPHGTVIDITADVVKFALPLTGVKPLSGDYHVATVDPTPVFVDSTGVKTFAVTLTVGPGAVVYTAGVYDHWVQVIDNPTQPAQKIDVVTFT
jgi:hypothetical protein